MAEPTPTIDAIVTSPTIAALAAALATAQGAMHPALKDSANPFYKSKYADLASIDHVVRAPLAAAGLAIFSAPVSAEAGRLTLVTRLMHGSGEWMQWAITVGLKDAGPQALGSAITYLRRYTISAALNVVTDDDDGERAEGREDRTRPVAPPLPPQPGTGNPKMAADIARAKAEAQAKKPLPPTQQRLAEAEARSHAEEKGPSPYDGYAKPPDQSPAPMPRNPIGATPMIEAVAQVIGAAPSFAPADPIPFGEDAGDVTLIEHEFYAALQPLVGIASLVDTGSITSRWGFLVKTSTGGDGINLKLLAKKAAGMVEDLRRNATTLTESKAKAQAKLTGAATK